MATHLPLQDTGHHVTTEQIKSLVSGTLDIAVRERIQEHLQHCRRCALTVDDAYTEALPLERAAKSHHPMPRPPMAILEATGVYQTGSANWSALRTLTEKGIPWAREELKRLQKLMEEVLRQWMIMRIQDAKRATSLTRGSHNDRAWPEQISVEIVNAQGQPDARPVECQVLAPPTLLASGTVRLVVRTDDKRVEGGRLQCTITLGTEKSLTVSGEWVPERDNWGWQAWLEESGFPICAEPRLIPPDQVQWSLRFGEQTTGATRKEPILPLPSMFLPLTEQYHRTLSSAQPTGTAQSQGTTPREPFAVRVWVQHDAEDAIDTIHATIQVPAFHLGEKIRIGYTINHKAYVYIIEVDTTGAISLVVPGPLRKDNQGDERWRYLVPHPDEASVPEEERFELPLNGPAGREVLIAIASKTPVAIIEKWKSEGAVSTTEFSTLFNVLSHLPHDTWALAQYQFEVTE